MSSTATKRSSGGTLSENGEILMERQSGNDRIELRYYGGKRIAIVVNGWPFFLRNPATAMDAFNHPHCYTPVAVFQ